MDSGPTIGNFSGKKSEKRTWLVQALGGGGVTKVKKNTWLLVENQGHVDSLLPPPLMETIHQKNIFSLFMPSLTNLGTFPRIGDRHFHTCCHQGTWWCCQERDSDSWICPTRSKGLAPSSNGEPPSGLSRRCTATRGRPGTPQVWETGWVLKSEILWFLKMVIHISASVLILFDIFFYLGGI